MVTDSFNLPVSSRIALSIKILSRARMSRIESQNFFANRRDFSLASRNSGSRYALSYATSGRYNNDQTSRQVVEKCSPSPVGRPVEISI